MIVITEEGGYYVKILSLVDVVLSNIKRNRLQYVIDKWKLSSSYKTPSFVEAFSFFSSCAKIDKFIGKIEFFLNN